MHLDQDQDHQRREIDSAEIGEHAPDRPVERRGEPVDRDAKVRTPLRAGVEHVEGEQPAQDTWMMITQVRMLEQEVGDVDEREKHGPA